MARGPTRATDGLYTLSMTKLQTPKFALRNGELAAWDATTLHIGSEAVTRALSVFEGIKGYWGADGSFGLVEVHKHYERLLRSARLLHIPCPRSFDEFQADIFRLVESLVSPEHDLWVRATLFVVEGHWGEGTVADLILTAYHQNKESREPIDLGVSTWQRSLDNALPYRIKSAANYQVARLARIEGRSRGFGDMILLNQWGRVAEATAAAVLIARNGVVHTPSHTEGALESITVDAVESIAGAAGLRFERRPIDRTELSIADEICICGTLEQMLPVRSIDGLPVDPDGPVLGELRRRYMAIVRRELEHEGVDITVMPS
jgi:branched-chain amino acid aminotransferase